MIVPAFKKFYNLITEEYSHCNTQIPIYSYDIFQFGLDNIKDSDLYEGTDKDDGDKGRQKVADLHCTVLYGFSEDVIGKVKEIAHYIKPFEITFGKVSLFRQENFDVLKVEVISDRLSKLHYLLKNSIPNEDKFPQYNSHITIAYVKKNSCDHLDGNTTFEGKSQYVSSFLFIHKNGWNETITLNNGIYTNYPTSIPTVGN